MLNLKKYFDMLYCLFSVIFLHYFCLKGYHCQNDIFNIAMDAAELVSQPDDRSCDNEGLRIKDNQRFNTHASLFGFSISIDESENALVIGAPNCNQVYKCPNFQDCKGIQSSFIDSSVQLGKQN